MKKNENEAVKGNAMLVSCLHMEPVMICTQEVIHTRNCKKVIIGQPNLGPRSSNLQAHKILLPLPFYSRPFWTLEAQAAELNI
jgi:hypothetical protein